MPKLYTRRDTNRMPQYDYSLPGSYFVTICTENRKLLFGTIENNQMSLNDTGDMVNSWWKNIFEKYDNVSIDEYIIMPSMVKILSGAVTAPLRWVV